MPLAAVSGAQCGLMLGVVLLLRKHEGSLAVQLLALVLAAWNGTAIGLLISAMSSNADKAMSVVPLTLIPQIILAGVLVPLPEMNAPERSLAKE